VSLTPDGHDYLEKCKRILAEIDAADDAMKRTRSRPQGKLRIDVPTEFGRHLLVPALPQFTTRYPELQLEIRYNERVIDLYEEQVDVTVRTGPVQQNLIARRVCRTRLLTCAAPAYLAERGMPQEPDQLRSHKLIGFIGNNTQRPRRWVFQKGRSRKQLALPFTVAFNTPEPAVSAVLAGTGILQVMDMLIAGHLASRKLLPVLADWSTEGPPISVVYPTTLRNSMKVRVFADFAAELLLQTRRKVDEFLASAM
jgi:LysR family transcriptional regulator for bpeEF and oprC